MLAGKGNPEKAWNALGVIRERGLISQHQHNAAWRYARLRRAVIGKDDANTSTREPNGDIGDGLDRRSREMEAAFDEARAMLLQAGRRAFDAVNNVAVFDRLPRWVFTTNPRGSDKAERDALMAGLVALCPRQAKAA